MDFLDFVYPSHPILVAMKALSTLFTLCLFSQMAFSQGQLSGVVKDNS